MRVRRLPLAAALALLLPAACAEPAGPVDTEGPAPAAQQHPGIRSAFESTERIRLASGEEVYIAGLYTAPADDYFVLPTYLIQIGMTSGPSARLLLYQWNYLFHPKDFCDDAGNCFDTMRLGGLFEGVRVILGEGHDSADLTVSLDGEDVRLVLPRKG
jgi:hypothetical protein